MGQKRKPRQKGINVKGALSYYNRTTGSKMSLYELGQKIDKGCSRYAAAMKMNRLQHEKSDTIRIIDVHKICDETGVDANYLFGITPLEINKTELTKEL